MVRRVVVRSKIVERVRRSFDRRRRDLSPGRGLIDFARGLRELDGGRIGLADGFGIADLKIERDFFGVAAERCIKVTAGPVNVGE